jgi:translation initiation factor IF-2
MNITELARRLRANPEELREKLPELGFSIGAKAIKVDDRLVAKITAKWSELKRMERLKAKYAKEERIKSEAVAANKNVALPRVISVRDFAGKMNLPVNMVIGELMKNGILANLNERIDYETASILAEDMGFSVTAEEQATAEDEAQMSAEELRSIIAAEAEEDLAERPPVIVVMGHVDHGKTSLLDAIRTTSVAAGESGGITQHIGAYQVEKSGRRITFIDTPGHEAFTVMRSRGARVADIAIVVVAADDGVQPQTSEVIDIVKAAGIPFIVALNKIDRPGVDLQRVKTQLSDKGVIPEEWGGKTIMAPVSARTRQGLDELLDMVLLVADMEKDKIRANPKRSAVGTVIDAHVDKGEGPVATLLVQSGTLRRGDSLAVGDALFGKVRAMKTWEGKFTEKAVPGMPVRILGFRTAPQVGDIVRVPEDVGELRQVKKQFATKNESSVVSGSIKSDGDEDEKRQYLNVVLKADVLGSLEAIVGTLEKMKSPEVAVRVIGKGLGNVTEGDVSRASASGGVVFGFNVSATREAEVIARESNVEIKPYKVVYHLFDFVKERLQEMLPVEIIRTDLGRLEVLANFRSDKTGQVIGGRVVEGHLQAGAQVVVYRGEEPVDEGKILELQSGKQAVKEIKSGSECGVKLSCRRPVMVGDAVQAFTVERKERKLQLDM